MLENDIVLERFMARHGESLEGSRLEAFKRLLEYSDGHLWDVICGRVPAPDAGVEAVVRLLRSPDGAPPAEHAGSAETSPVR
jgi:succinate dehydrogenase flavin-adding protein (antitoxin of CptAB toxin-antitoxin module)